MIAKTITTAAASLALVATPALAQEAAADRAPAQVDNAELLGNDDDDGGSAAGLLLGLGAIAAIIAAVIIAFDDDDEDLPVSP
ncbi:hypothetical protein [Aurantiacibacter aquimixticola]|uniref:Uncharacterized protein n=1 Tax=Aurantiacibacter aquimixticola TaxID=1958945 RepID=A0A419RTD3_9SPHN|nr:hypothetical protein [Aurantiacibacter aquimixticola]RJY09036.1 hypothetical protein D6201_06365 [Aurantiacibacter aquimixticola]